MEKIFPQIEINENIFKVEIDFSSIQIDETKIGYEIGYQNGEMPEHFSELLKEIITSVPELCEVKAGYVLSSLNYSKDYKNQLIIGDKIFHTDKIVTSQLRKADKAAIFLCTIGKGMESWSKNLYSEGQSIMSYLVDITASTIVEEVADLLHDHITYSMKENDLNTTNRYSPGYCNWSVAEQKKIFSFFPKDYCDVRLSESNLMTPIKSISGVIGIGKEVEYKEYLCDRCGIKDCTHRIYLTKKQKRQIKV